MTFCVGRTVVYTERPTGRYVRSKREWVRGTYFHLFGRRPEKRRPSPERESVRRAYLSPGGGGRECVVAEGIGTKGPERIATELVNGKMQVCRFFGEVVQNVQTEVSCYEKGENDRGVYKKLSTIQKWRFWAKSDFSTELSTMSTKIDRQQ